MGTKEIQRLICKMEVLNNNVVCENIDALHRCEYDVLSISKSGLITEFEVKISRSDFLADRKKTKHTYYCKEGLVTSWTPNYFLYVCPEGLIKENELPEYAGLMYAKDGQLFTIKPVKRIHKERHDIVKIQKRVLRMISERTYLGSCRMTYENKISKERYEHYEKLRNEEQQANEP